jgi:hypothetical protein
MAAMKIHISASAKEALDAVGGYYTELRGTWALDLYRQSIRFFFVAGLLSIYVKLKEFRMLKLGIL